MSDMDMLTTIKTATLNILNALEDGQRTTKTDLTDKVVAETGLKISIISGVVSMIVQEWVAEGQGVCDRGRKGGIYKGARIQRVDMRQRCPSCSQVVRPKAQ